MERGVARFEKSRPIRLRQEGRFNGAYTYYKWKPKYGGLAASDLTRLKELESELAQYKRMYAELAHDNYALKDVISKQL